MTSRERAREWAKRMAAEKGYYLAEMEPTHLLVAEEFLAMDAALREAEAALDKIACWSDGHEVTPCFDSPWASTLARQALEKLRGGS